MAVNWKDFTPIEPPKAKSVDWAQFEPITEPTPQERENVRRGLNPDGTPLRPGAGRGEVGDTRTARQKWEETASLEDRDRVFSEEQGVIGPALDSMKRGWEGLKSSASGALLTPMIESGAQAELEGDVVIANDPQTGRPLYASEVYSGDQLKQVVDAYKAMGSAAARDLAKSAVASNQATAGLPVRPSTEAVTGAKTFGEGWEAFKTNPLGVVGDLGVQSSTQMAPALLATIATRSPTVAAITAGLSSGGMEYGSGVVDYLAQNGVDISNEEAITQALSNPETVNKALGYAKTRAGIVGAVDAASAGIAGKVLIPARVASRAGVREAANTFVAQPAAQMIAGAGGEAAAQLATTGEIRPGEVISEAVGEMFTAPGEAATFAYERQAQKLKELRAVADTPEQAGTLDAGIALAEARAGQAEKKGYYAQKRAENAAKAAETVNAGNIQDSGASVLNPPMGTAPDVLGTERSVDMGLPAAKPVDRSGSAPILGDQDAIDEAELFRMLSDAFPDNYGETVEQDVPQDAVLASRNVDEPPQDTGIEAEELDPNDPVIQRMLAEQQAGMAARDLERREGPSDAISEGLRAVAENPTVFRSRLYEGKNIGEIASEGNLPYSQRSQDPEYNANVYHFVVDQGAKGKNEARIHEGKNDVWVDVSDLKSGGGRGEEVYSAAFSLARNTGKNFIEDPRGLSDTAMYRRVIQELSGILKADDSSNVPVGEFLASQRAGGPKTRPVPVDPGRKLNPAIRERALTAHANAILAVPEVKGIRYDTDTNQFVDRAGQAVTDADFDRLAEYRRANPIAEAMVRKRTDSGDKSAAPIGGNTLKLAALVETLRVVPEGDRSRVVGQLRALASGSDGLGSLKGILPSRRAEDGQDSNAGRSAGVPGKEATGPVDAPGESGVRGLPDSNDGRVRGRTPKTKGIGVDAIRDTITRTYGSRAKRLLDSGKTKVVQLERDVPTEIRSRSEPLASADGTIQGFYDQKTGDSYLIADNFKRIDDVGPVFLHEEGVHAGMKAILGDRFDAIAKRLGEIAENGNEADKAIAAKAKRRAERAGTPDKYLNEEWIAYTVQLAEQAKQANEIGSGLRRWLKSVYEAISAWAAQRGLKNLSINDLRVIAIGTLGHRVRVGDTVTPSRASKGTDETTGLPLNKDGTVTLYHHTSAANAAKIRETGMLKSAGEPSVYLTTQRDTDTGYGDTAVAVRVKPELLNLDDEFPDGRKDFSVDVRKPGGSIRVQVEPKDTITVDGEDGVLPSRVVGETPIEDMLDSSDELKRAKKVDAYTDSAQERIYDAKDAARAKRQEAASSLGVTGPSLSWELDEGRFEGGMKASFNRLREQLQDKYLSVLGAQGDIEKVTGQLIKESQNVYRRENLMHGRVADQMKTLHDRRVMPIKRAMKDEGVSLEAVEDFMEARAAEDRNKHIASINPGMQDGGSGMLTQEAKDFLDGKTEGYRSKEKLTPELRKKVEGIVSRLDTIRDETLAKQRDSGLITHEQYDSLIKNRTYAPLRGKDGEEIGGQGTGGGVDVRGKPFQKALGRGEGNRAKDIVANIIGDAERTITQSEKTRVGQTLLRLVLANPNKDVWEVEPVKVERKFSEAQGIVYDAIQAIDNDPGSVRVMVKGKPYRIVLKDARMAAAVKNLGAEQLNSVFRFLGAINRYFSAILTRYNPSFVPINMIRDLGMGIVGITSEHGLRAGKDAVVSYLPAMRALWREARGKSSSGQSGAYAREFTEAGGRTGFHSYQNVEEITNQIRNELKSVMQIIRDKDTNALNKIARVYSKGATGLKENALIQVIEDANDTIENSMRLAAFIARRKKGHSIESAAEYAKNITVNFNRRGHATSVVNSMFLFFNAATQGSVRTFQLLKQPKVMGVMAGLASLQFVLAAIAMGDEDDDGVTAWEKIPDYEKERNLIFPIVGEENGRMKVKLIKVPMPYGFNFFPYLGGRLAQAMKSSSEQDTWKLSNDLGAAAIDSVSPVKFTGGTRGYLPYLANIFVSLGYNKNDFGDRITNEQPYSAYEVPRASLGRASTPEIYHKAAKALNRAGGGDEVTPPKIMANLLDWSPEDLKYLTEAFTGGIGRTLNQTVGLGQKAYSGLDLSTSDVPVLKSIVADVDMERATQGTYYERKETIARETARVRAIYSEKGKEAAIEHMKQTPALDGMELHRFKTGKVENKDGNIQLDAKKGGLYYTYKQAEKALSEITEELKSVRQSDLPMAERLKKVEELEKAREAAQRKLNVKWRDSNG